MSTINLIVIVYCICAGGICSAYIRNFILYYNYTNNDIRNFIYNIAIIIILINYL